MIQDNRNQPATEAYKTCTNPEEKPCTCKSFAKEGPCAYCYNDCSMDDNPQVELPYTKGIRVKVLVDDNKLDKYFPKTNKKSVISTKEMYPVVCASQREGKITPTKSELALSSNFENGSKYPSSQLTNMHSLKSAFSLFSQKSTQKVRKEVQSCRASKDCSSSTSDPHSRHIGVYHPELATIHEVPVATENPKKAVKSYNFHLKSCRSKEVFIYKMYKEDDLKLNKHFIQHIIPSVS